MNLFRVMLYSVISMGGIVVVNYMCSQKWLDSIASEQAIDEDIKKVCDGDEKARSCAEQINSLNSNGQTGLMIHARLGHLAEIKELLAYKANPNIISNDPARTTALHLACQSVDFVNGGRVVMFLLNSGARAKTKDAHGNIPLHDLLSASSALKKQQITALMLGVHNVDINTQNNDGDTPLHLAVTKNDLDWIQYIIAHYLKKIKFTLKNNRGYTPLALAQSYGYDQLVDILQKAMKKQ